MRITFVGPSVGTIAGGTETTIRELARVLAEDHAVSILTGRSRAKPSLPYEDPPNVNMVTVPYWPRFTPANAFASRLLRGLDPYRLESLSFFASFLLSPRARRVVESADVISTHFRTDSELFSAWASRRRVASVFHVQGSDLGRWFKLLDRSTRYVAVGDHARITLERKTGIRMHGSIPPGIPDSFLTATRSEQDEILFVGRLQPSKRADWAIRVYREISKEFPTTRMTIVGDGPARRRLEDLVSAYGLQGRVAFAGEISHTTVSEYYTRSKLLLMPSMLETFALVPLEAMACGCAVLASDVPSLRASAAPAVFAPPEDLEAWIELAKDLLASPEKRRAMSEAGRAWARSFGWRRVARTYERELRLAAEAMRSAPSAD